DNFTQRVDDVVAMRSDALLMHLTTSGIDRASGGRYERGFLTLHVFGADGRRTRLEDFDADREDQALARFDELTEEWTRTSGGVARPLVENAAMWSVERFIDAWQTQDWERCTTLFAPGFRCHDRRKLMQLDLDRDHYLRFLRPAFEMSP